MERIKIFLPREKGSCTAGGKGCVMTALKVQSKELECVQQLALGMVLGTGLGTKLTVIRGLPEEPSHISGNCF